MELSFGKYKGTDPMDLVGKDESYIFWLLKDGSKFINNLSMKCYIRDKVLPHCQFPFGKHKGKTFAHMYNHEMDYLDWLLQNTNHKWI